MAELCTILLHLQLGELNDDDQSNRLSCPHFRNLLDLASHYEHQSRGKTDYRTDGRTRKETGQKLSGRDGGRGNLVSQKRGATMQRLLISYDLLEPNRTQANRKSLYAALDSLGAVQIQDSVWAVRTEMSVAYVIANLQGHFGPTDRLLVAKISDFLSRRGIHKVPRL
jgi:hypothetical protein